ncbi:MAG: hypothetical protein K5745_06125, partial [Saccharofermentans sp.]|nr:hypothetical protein [Saccharofermentans sp.]
MKKDKNDTLTIEEISKFIPRDTDSVVAARKEVQSGHYINTYFPFYPGIFLFLNEVHATNIKVGTFPKGTEMIVMNYCISGRCEFKTNTDRYKYLTDNNLSIGGYIVRESFFYPTDYYLGFEVGIVEAMFTPETYEVLEGFGIDIEKLRTISRKHNGLLILEANSKLQKLWLEMYGNSGEDTMLIKLKMLEILRILTTSDLGETEKAVYLTRSQTELARTVQRRLTEDISRHVSMRELSLELNV